MNESHYEMHQLGDKTFPAKFEFNGLRSTHNCSMNKIK